MCADTMCVEYNGVCKKTAPEGAVFCLFQFKGAGVEYPTAGRGLAPTETFPPLRSAGIEAEKVMYLATGGVNTHKGALFSLGIVCCGAGRLGEGARMGDILSCAGNIAQYALKDFDDLSELTPVTGGERQFLESGLTGIRGEAANGFPSVREIGLPALDAALDRGENINDAGLHALLSLMAAVIVGAVTIVYNLVAKKLDDVV